MKRDEADQEAQRLNANDDRAARLEFYPLDQSAGMSDDAWDVASRLRRRSAAATAEPSPWSPPRRVTAPAGATPQPAPWDEPEAAPALADPEPTLAPAPPAAVEHAPLEEPYPEPYPAAAYVAEPDAGDAYAAEPYPGESHPDEAASDSIGDTRPGLLVRLVGGAVMLVALVWVIAVVGLAIVLDSWGPTSLLIYFGAAGLGLGGLALGVAIRRS